MASVAPGRAAAQHKRVAQNTIGNEKEALFT
jgi:hypothetical protein